MVIERDETGEIIHLHFIKKMAARIEQPFFVR
jgi:hypothetical protein